MAIEKEFKIAIQNLPVSEKDKLIFRLLRKDKDLAKRLYFELVDTRDCEELREELARKLDRDIERLSNRIHSFPLLLVETRNLSGEITQHVKTTKDKYGEISLNIQLINKLLKLNKDKLISQKPKNYYTFCVYCIAKIFKITLLIDNISEDLKRDFSEELEELGKQINTSHILNEFARYNGLDVNWLINNDIPENIQLIYKKLRSEGLIR